MFNATFVVSLISFILFVFIMNRILYEPINEIVEKRKKLVDGNYQTAQDNKKKIQDILEDRLNKLNEARDKVRHETAIALDKVKKDIEHAENLAKDETEQIVKENIDALNQNKVEAVNVLKQDVINLAQIISDKFLEAPERITEINTDTIEKIMQD